MRLRTRKVFKTTKRSLKPFLCEGALRHRKTRELYSNNLRAVGPNHVQPGGDLTRFWTGTCHRSFKNIPLPYTNFSKMYTRPYTNLRSIYPTLYQFFVNAYPTLYQLSEKVKLPFTLGTRPDSHFLFEKVPFLIPKS